ncbi:nmrA-like family protein [Aaosphaeria arxii CBS 175.79]|uniref:NmrA-like family protein n=1 Tax=Aaosphaeria arxii CBS 175.79 TaxID=1450172 RepID=A0A6A5XUT9_9PLEO|nr:nmrA-like family protein [Aaosphaeria arxii CBS 175.79]KAF2017078.1 nmrA-like family protein [Aaosphaeria arxii CBS 175.79]
MVRVAIAGGGGKLGRTILDVLSEQDEHEAFVLSRKASQDRKHGAAVLQVDYTDIESMTQTLEENRIDTVICTIGYHGNSLEVAQMNLIRAAMASRTTRRFVPSTFAISYPRESVKELSTLTHYFAAIDLLESSDLQYTVFLNGCFLDYWAMPHIKTHLSPAPFAVDVASRTAAIPGDGEARVTFTYSYDVARFVVRLLGEEEWEPVSKVAGDVKTWNEFVGIAEGVIGEKFKVTYDSVEELKEGRMTELPSQVECYETFPKPQFQWFMSIFSRWTADENVGFVEGTLNERFPDIQCLDVRNMIEKYWKSK